MIGLFEGAQMKQIFTALTLGTALLTGAVSAQTTGIRDVTASERSLVTLATKIRYTTMLILPPGEEIVDVLCGDAGNWVISATANIAHVKPAKEGAQTNLNLVSTSGAIYSFLLTEVSEQKPSPQADLKVYVTAGGDLANKGKPKYYSAATVEKQVSALETEVKAAHSAVEAAQKVAGRAVDEAAAKAALAIRCDYDQVPYTKPFLIRSICTNGQFTYVRTDAQELPALYELKDGQPALVNFQVPQPGMYVVPKVVDEGYFSVGKARLPFKARNQ